MKNLDLGKNENSSKGITLVALVISIIVLLILATVSINLIINNGILDKAKLAVDKYSEGEELEQIQLAVLSAQMKNRELTTDNLNMELKSNFNDNKEVKSIKDYWKYKGYKIDKDGNVEKLLLPEEYQQIEYIESTGTQYIDVLFKANQDTKLICEAVITDEFKSGYYQALFGASDYTSKEINRNVIHMHRASASNLIVMASYGDQIHNTGFSGDITQRHIYELNKNIYKVDNKIVYTYPMQTFMCTKNINIFRDDNTLNQEKRYCNMKLYSFEIYDDENLVRKLMPCYSTITVTNANGDSVLANTKGLYDLVEDKFYTNKNTSIEDFTAGPEV